MAAALERWLEELVARCVPALVEHAEEAGRSVPRHAVRALGRFGGCGDPVNGFALLTCGCGLYRVVPFRCHVRGVCPTCGGRSMASGAAHLVDRVLPAVGVRQWVLTVPWPRRYLLARHADLCAAVRRLVWRRLCAWYRRRAAALGSPGGEGGGVVVVQRFSSSLALNVHFHVLALDGVYVADAGGAPRFVSVPAPTTAEVGEVVADLASRVEALLTRRGFGAASEGEEVAVDEDGTEALFEAAVAGRVAHGVRAGARVRRRGGGPTRTWELPPRCAEWCGYNLHADVVVGADRRESLERLCRYVLRPALARARLERRADGLIELRLRRAWADGTQAFVYSELELTEKLAALVPPAHRNVVSYFGVLAPRHRWRSQVVPSPPAAAPSRGRLTREPSEASRWLPMADLLWRVFCKELFVCRCGQRLTVHAVVLPPATLDVLASLEGARAPPRVA